MTSPYSTILKRNSRSFVKSSFPLFTARRHIISQAYACEEAWQKRFESPLIKNIKMDMYFLETDKKFATKKLASGVDIDLFAISVQDESQLDELEHLLYRFRKTKRAAEMMDSTSYAVIKSFLKFRSYESLMRILNDRDSYGVFPDFYSYNILMSSFLNEKMYKEAAQIAVLMMLQEDFSNKISQALGLLSCQTFLNECEVNSLYEESGEVEEDEVEEKKAEPADDDEDEEEVTLIRVPFLRNPFFDDHFHLTNPKHLIGKTFYLIGREMNNTLGRSYQLVGLAMYEKWDKASSVLQSFVETENIKILNETVEKVLKEINLIADDENKIKETHLKKFQDNFEKLRSQGKLVEKAFSVALGEELNEALKSEPEDIATQTQSFRVWEELRRSAIDKQNKELEKERRLKVIEEKKEYLYWKEKLLFFFENEEQVLEEEKKIKEEMETLKAARDLKKVEDTYVPPEILKRAPEKLSKYKKLALVKKLQYKIVIK